MEMVQWTKLFLYSPCDPCSNPWHQHVKPITLTSQTKTRYNDRGGLQTASSDFHIHVSLCMTTHMHTIHTINKENQ